MSLPSSDLAALRRMLLDPLPLSERTGRRREGRPDGAWAGRYPDGTLGVEGTYLRGRRHGLWRRFTPDGCSVEIRFLFGVPDGRLTAWWPDGAPALEATFRRGAIDGHVSLWDRSGRLHLRPGLRTLSADDPLDVDGALADTGT